MSRIVTFFFFVRNGPKRAQYRIATICGIAASGTHIFIHTSVYVVPNITFAQILRRKQMLQRVPSPFSIRSRHNLHTSSMQQQQQQRYRGSSPPRARLQGQRQDPQSPSHQWLRRLRPSFSRSPSLSPSLPCLAVLCAFSALLAP